MRSVKIEQYNVMFEKSRNLKCRVVDETSSNKFIVASSRNDGPAGLGTCILLKFRYYHDRNLI